MGSVSEFLLGMPSRDPDNFQRWSSENIKPTRRPVSCVQTVDVPAQQVIVTEKTNILLRYLHQRIENSAHRSVRKRDSSTETDDPESKRMRY